MAWSTREVAELAGTTVRAVRHYHEVGLLDEPRRRANGYKQYGVAHLVRVLRIKRLIDLGFSLTQVAELGDADEHPEQALRTLDAELGGTIERLQRVRVELSLLLRQAAPTDLPLELSQATTKTEFSAADRALLVVLTRVLGPQGLRTFAELLRSYRSNPGMSAFDELPADADEPTRKALAERLFPYIRDLVTDHPGLLDVNADAPSGAHFAARTFGLAVQDLYNPAQIDVLARIAHVTHQ